MGTHLRYESLGAPIMMWDIGLPNSRYAIGREIGFGLGLGLEMRPRDWGIPGTLVWCIMSYESNPCRADRVARVRSLPYAVGHGHTLSPLSV